MCLQKQNITSSVFNAQKYNNKKRFREIPKFQRGYNFFKLQIYAAEYNYILRYACVFIIGVVSGQCQCREGFSGRRCDRCSFGYRDFPLCSKCECNLAGSTNVDPCEECVCKVNIQFL